METLIYSIIGALIVGYLFSKKIAVLKDEAEDEMPPQYEGEDEAYGYDVDEAEGRYMKSFEIHPEKIVVEDRMKKTIVPINEKEDQDNQKGILDDFDPVKAIIYSEIMKPKHTEY